MFPFIDLKIITIPIYSSLFITGFFLAVLAARKTGPRFGISKEDILYASVYAAIGLLIGAKLLYFITKLPSLLTNWSTVTDALRTDARQAILWLANYSFGGMVFYGGLIGAILGILRYCRHFHIPFTPYLDTFAPLIPFIHGIGRIGCFCAGCCYGIEYHGPGSISFPHNDMIPGLDAVPRFPVQLFEAGLNFILCIILFHLSKKEKMKNGKTMGVYLIYYSIARFGLEMLRGDKIRGSISIFSTSQLISILLIIPGLFLLCRKGKES